MEMSSRIFSETDSFIQINIYKIICTGLALFYTPSHEIKELHCVCTCSQIYSNIQFEFRHRHNSNTAQVQITSCIYNYSTSDLVSDTVCCIVKSVSCVYIPSIVKRI